LIGVGTLALGGWAGAIRYAQIKNIEKKLLRVDAVSIATAVTPETAKITSERELGWLNSLVKQGRIGRTKDGRVWWIK
jgi:phosphoglycerate dehydrogenase-like enzyme